MSSLAGLATQDGNIAQMPLTPEEKREMVKTLQKLCEEAQALHERLSRAMKENARADRQMQTPMSERRTESRKSG